MKHYLMNPTWDCQNHCPHCWVQRSIARRPLREARRRPLEDWVAAIRRDPPDIMDIAGGEPLLVPWLLDLLQALPGIPFALSTNLRAEGAVMALTKAQLKNVVSITISYHPDTEAREYTARWLGAALRLKSAGYPLTMNVVDYCDYADRSGMLVPYLQAMGMAAVLSPYEEVAHLRVKRPHGLRCQGGVNHLTIAPDGEAWPCLTSLRSPYYEEYRLGNWLDGTIDLTRKAQPCYLECVDHFLLRHKHSSGDMWGICAEPAEPVAQVSV